MLHWTLSSRRRPRAWRWRGACLKVGNSRGHASRRPSVGRDAGPAGTGERRRRCRELGTVPGLMGDADLAILLLEARLWIQKGAVCHERVA